MSLPSIAKLASKHGISPMKKLGQNFIFDESLCDKVARTAFINSDDIVVEIGPGPAGLTRSILKLSPRKLYAIETDKRCIPLLEEIKTYHPNLEIICDDALKKRLYDISTLEKKKVKIVANLPYNIGTILLLNWLKELEYIESMTLMLQREVVDRIVARDSSKAYGRLSVMVQNLCSGKKAFDVSPDAFYPPPKVWSSIVYLEPKELLPGSEIINKLEKITHYAFSGRRKMLKSSLKQLSPDIENILAKCGINPTWRAENLTPENYLLLAQHLA